MFCLLAVTSEVSDRQRLIASLWCSCVLLSRSCARVPVCPSLFHYPLRLALACALSRPTPWLPCVYQIVLTCALRMPLFVAPKACVVWCRAWGRSWLPRLPRLHVRRPGNWNLPIRRNPLNRNLCSQSSATGGGGIKFGVESVQQCGQHCACEFCAGMEVFGHWHGRKPWKPAVLAGWAV